MVVVKDKSIESILMDSHLKIVNCRDDKAIAPAMAIYGFVPETYDGGMVIYKKTVDLHRLQKDESSEQWAATEALQKLVDDVDKVYMQHVSIGRMVLRGNSVLLRRAALEEERMNTFTGWFGQLRAFYDTFINNSDASSAMGKFLITPEILAANMEKANVAEQLKQTQAKEAGDAQRATKLRDEALEELMRWVADLVVVARVALADSPQLLEKLNIIVPS
ncbi:MAG: hypothetical protein GY940_25815 [bacterium]|nr:hypothetical protein [bacterium]